MRPEVVRRVAPLAVAAAVLAAVGIVWLVTRGADPAGGGPGAGGSSTDLDPLHLSSWIAPGETTADPRYRLAPGADLPEGPRQSAVFTLRPQPDRRAALAGALGRGADRLTVQPDGSWGLGGSVVCAEPGGGDTPVSSPAESDGNTSGSSGGGTSGSTGSGASGSDGLPVPPARDCPTTAPSGGSGDPLAVARPVLQAAGLDDEHADVDDSGGGTAIVRVDPQVDGLPTDGFTTWLEVAGSRVVSAQGWLTTAERGPAYPVVSARTAFEDFVRTPHPMPMIACPEPAPDIDTRLMCGGPVVVTGATFGLSLQYSDNGPLLVPSWLFTVKGSAQPVVQVAVEPRLVVQGAPDPGPGGMELGTATAKPPQESVDPYPTMPAN